MESIKTKQLDTVAKKYDYDVKFVQKVNLLDENLPELPRQRNLVQWLFKDETKLGDVKRFSMTNGGYVVAQMSGITPEGSVNIESVKSDVVQQIMKKKKAVHLLKTHTDKNSLGALSAATEKEIETASAVTQKILFWLVQNRTLCYWHCLCYGTQPTLNFD